MMQATRVAAGGAGRGRPGILCNACIVGLAALAASACAKAELTADPRVGTGLDAGWDGTPFDMDRPGRIIVDPFAGSCAHQSVRAQSLPIDLVFMVDSSGSMNELTTSGATKWTAIKSAFASFFRAPGSGVGAGLHFFPQNQAGVPDKCSTDSACGSYGPCIHIKACAAFSQLIQCQTDAQCGTGGGPCLQVGQCARSGGLCAPIGENCDTNDPCVELEGFCAQRELCEQQAYLQPAVNVAALPGAATALTNALNTRVPEGGTPTGPALAGAIERAHTHALSNLNHRVAVVLATDGFPTTCEPQSIPETAAIAAAGLQRAPAVPTFVIGVFSPGEAAQASLNLNAIATAGGSQRAFIVNTGTDVNQTFLKALNDIRAAALACEYQLPENTGQIDYGAVNIRVNEKDGTVSTIGKVAGPEHCNPQQGGWYYDVEPSARDAGATDATSEDAGPVSPGPPVTPKLISTCPATCAFLRENPGGRVDLVFGCKTIVID